jgi:hypothetical protein
MKGKAEFTKTEIEELRRLIILRNKATKSEQKNIRNKMRKMEFYGRDDWEITNMQISDLDMLIKLKKITITDI